MKTKSTKNARPSRLSRLRNYDIKIDEITRLDNLTKRQKQIPVAYKKEDVSPRIRISKKKREITLKFSTGEFIPFKEAINLWMNQKVEESKKWDEKKFGIPISKKDLFVGSYYNIIRMRDLVNQFSL